MSTTLRTSALSSVSKTEWNRLVGAGTPFLEWEILSALESSGCTSGENGWLAQHVLVEESDELVAASPIYIKAHSAGEFVFDHEWAYAAERAGLAYYPKLVAAAPFTPVTGPRMLVRDGADSDRLRMILARGAWEVGAEMGMSGLHWLFVTPAEARVLEAAGYGLRAGVQFHWHNRGYRDVDDWLAGFSSKRRRNMRRERRGIEASGVQVEVLEGPALDEAMMETAYTLYLSTIDKKMWGRQYLDRGVFARLGERARERLVFIVARQEGRLIAGALYLQKGGALYGRYWGCLEEVPFLHFELCCYRPVQLCIERGWSRFDAGAQGGHKYERGFDPVITWSAHRFRDPRLDAGVRQFLDGERTAILRQRDLMRAQSPCRQVRETSIDDREGHVGPSR